MADDNKAISMYLEKKGLRTRTHWGDEEVRTLTSQKRKQKGKARNASSRFCCTHNFALSQILCTFSCLWTTRSFWLGPEAGDVAVTAPWEWWEWEKGPSLPGSYTAESPKVDLRLGSVTNTLLTLSWGLQSHSQLSCFQVPPFWNMAYPHLSNKVVDSLTVSPNHLNIGILWESSGC